MYVKFCIYYIPFVFYENNRFLYKPYYGFRVVFIESKYKGDNSVKNQNRDSPIKRSVSDCTC